MSRVIFINMGMKILEKILKFIISAISGQKTPENTEIQTNEKSSVAEKPETKEFVMENQITKNFTLKELTYSSTAVKRKIDNTPTEAEYKNMVNLCEKILQPLRDKLGKPITINSCYRSPKLNAAVGGAKKSQHMTGKAADIEVKGMSNYDLAIFIKNNFKFDQLILEYCDNLKNDINSGWVHVSYDSNENRNQCLTINKSGTKVGLYK